MNCDLNGLNCDLLQVNIYARDGGVPSFNQSPQSAQVTITVIRNTAPRFINRNADNNYESGGIPMNLPPGGTVFQTQYSDTDTDVGC